MAVNGSVKYVCTEEFKGKWETQGLVNQQKN